MRFLLLSWWMQCGFKVQSCRLLSAFAGRVRHLVGARMYVYCASCVRASSYSFIMWTATQASFITRHVALTDDGDANGLVPTATARVAAFYRSAHTRAVRAHPARACEKSIFAEQSEH